MMTMLCVHHWLTEHDYVRADVEQHDVDCLSDRRPTSSLPLPVPLPLRRRPTGLHRLHVAGALEDRGRAEEVLPVPVRGLPVVNNGACCTCASPFSRRRVRKC